MTILNEKNMFVGMILENDTCYMRIGKIIEDTVYIEKLEKVREKLIWTQMSKSQLIKSSPDIINRVPDKHEKISKEVPLYVDKNKHDLLTQEEVKGGITVMIHRDKSLLKNPIQLCVIKVDIVKIYEYLWSTGLWTECSDIGRGEEYEIEKEMNSTNQNIDKSINKAQKAFNQDKSIFDFSYEDEVALIY